LDPKERDKLTIAIKRCIESTFSSSHWDELAYLTGAKNIIYEHPRLLRSLYFGDDDYGSCVLRVVEELVNSDPETLQTIIEYIDLPSWLKENYPEDYEELFGSTEFLIDKAEETAISNSFELHQHLRRIRRSIDADPELAIGSTKEMLESVLKTIIEGYGEEVGKDDLPKLLKRAQILLEIDPRDVGQSAKGAEVVRRTLSNLGQIVIGISEMRNLFGTGHGKVRRPRITPRHARLVVGSGATLAIFLMETYEHRMT